MKPQVQVPPALTGDQGVGGGWKSPLSPHRVVCAGGFQKCLWYLKPSFSTPLKPPQVSWPGNSILDLSVQLLRSCSPRILGMAPMCVTEDRDRIGAAPALAAVVIEDQAGASQVISISRDGDCTHPWRACASVQPALSSNPCRTPPE